MDEQTAENIVRVIIKDLSGRHGLKWEWEAIEEDIKLEIIEQWKYLVLKYAS